MTMIDNIKTKRDALEVLIDLYAAISTQIEAENNPSLARDRKQIDKHKAETTDAIRKKLLEIEGENEQIEFLKSNLEDILEDNQQDELEFFKGYCETLIRKIDDMPDIDKDKEIILKLIREAENVKIYQDKSEKEKISYGDFLETNLLNEKDQTLYHDANMRLIQKSKYETHKNIKQNNNSKVCASLDIEELSKYEFQVRYEENKTAAIEFFGETSLGEQIRRKKLEYFSPMLAAIEMADRRGRKHIGRLTMIDEDLQTFVTQYDDKLEQAVNDLIKREKRRNEIKSSPAKSEKEKNEDVQE